MGLFSFFNRKNGPENSNNNLGNDLPDIPEAVFIEKDPQKEEGREERNGIPNGDIGINAQLHQIKWKH